MYTNTKSLPLIRIYEEDGISYASVGHGVYQLSATFSHTIATVASSGAAESFMHSLIIELHLHSLLEALLDFYPRLDVIAMVIISDYDENVTSLLNSALKNARSKLIGEPINEFVVGVKFYE